jgi:hypothetical protein
VLQSFAAAPLANSHKAKNPGGPGLAPASTKQPRFRSYHDANRRTRFRRLR